MYQLHGACNAYPLTAGAFGSVRTAGVQPGAGQLGRAGRHAVRQHLDRLAAREQVLDPVPPLMCEELAVITPEHLQELRIESFFPADEQTRIAMVRLAGQ